MKHPRNPSALLGLLATALLCALAPLPNSAAQGSFTLTFEMQNYPVQSANAPTSVDFSDNIIVNPANAEVSCTPSNGSSFERGATLVECSASLNGAERNGNFYVLVGIGNDTDVELTDITQDPVPVPPAGFVTYNLDFRATFPTVADRVILTGTLPSQLAFVSSDNPNCDASALPRIVCTVFSLQPGFPKSFTVRAQVKPGVSGSFQFPWTVSLGNGQRDLRANNNSFVANTTVQPPAAPNQIFLPLLNR